MTLKRDHVQVPASLAMTTALILHALADDQRTEGQHRNAGVTEHLATELDRAITKGRQP